MQSTDVNSDMFEVLIFKDNTTIKYMMVGCSFDDVKRQIVHEKKASLVHIRSLTGDTEMPLCRNGITAQIFDLSNARRKRSFR